MLDHQPLAAATSGVRDGGLDADDVDYEQLLALPILGALSTAQVQSWLQGLKKRARIELSEERRADIGKHATLDGVDGAPSNVYDRLAREGFWRDGL